MKCECCGNTISILRIGGSWPTYITCSSCKEQYSIPYGHIIGLAYVLIAMPLMLTPFLLSTLLGNEQNALISGSIFGLEPLAIFGPMVIYLASSILYGSLLARKCTFVRRNAASDETSSTEATEASA